MPLQVLKQFPDPFDYSNNCLIRVYREIQRADIQEKCIWIAVVGRAITRLFYKDVANIVMDFAKPTEAEIYKHLAIFTLTSMKILCNLDHVMFTVNYASQVEKELIARYKYLQGKLRRGKKDCWYEDKVRKSIDLCLVRSLKSTCGCAECEWRLCYSNYAWAVICNGLKNNKTWVTTCKTAAIYDGRLTEFENLRF